jgi:glucuronoarabinoxylan endo-1,4-beta-xylanase
MKSARPSLALSLAISMVLYACGSLDPTGGSTPTAVGGAAPTGGSGASSTAGEAGIGGANASGGMVEAGGNMGSGGAAPNSAGGTSTGGASVTGGAPASGGASVTGGAPASGGASLPGGAPASGGTSTGGRVDTGGTGTGGMALGGAGSAETGGATEPGTGGATVITACSTGTAQPGDVTVSLSSLQQRISGFGVSSAWAGDFRDPENDPDMLWSTTTGAGLTLHRIRIGGGTTSETRIAQRAVEYGVRVWATPWEVNEADTDRPMCPTNDPCDPPPKLTDPEDWANRLVDFVATMEDAGVPIYAISAENEPDSGGMNHTVSFTATELAEWIGGYLGPALANTNTKVMAPETMNWWGFPEYFTAIQDNGAAWEHVSIFASHAYGLGPREPEPAITDAGKEYWQTEVDTGRAADDPTGDNMPTALNLAETIHSHLTQANLNAWHYWWLWAGGTSGVFNTDTNVWTKRLWVMGNFSRFVRPGYRRVSTSGTAPSGVLISAYTNSADGTVVVVAINHNTSATSVSLFIADAAPCTVTPWVTSDTDNIAAETPITVTDARFTASLEAKSVTSFVGTP